MKRYHAFIAFVAVAVVCHGEAGALSSASKTDAWMDDTKTLVVTRTQLPPASKEEDVRAQIAGVMDTMFSTGLLLRPERVEFSSFEGLPACIVEGFSYANFTKRRCRIVVAFSQTDTFVIHSFSPAEKDLPDATKVAKVEGKGNDLTKEAFAYLRPRMAPALPELQKAVDALVALQKKG